MWKPGTAKPAAVGPPRAQTPPSRRPTTPENGHNNTRGSVSDSKLPAQNSDSKKKLSGSTLNMRFMKRKVETQQQQQKQRQKQQQRHQQGSEPSSLSSPAPSSRTPPPPAKVQTSQSIPPSNSQLNYPQQQTPKDMEIDQDSDNDNETTHLGQNSTTLTRQFPTATPSDMYGIQSDLMGRRSFGGFNPSMEEAWKDSKDLIETGRMERSKQSQHITDEELVQRYQDVVKNRGDDGDRRIKKNSKRTVGNLQGKVKKQKYQRT